MPPLSAHTTFVLRLFFDAARAHLALSAHNCQGAFATWPLVFVVAANFSGFTIRLPVVRVWFTWLSDISYCRWLYQVLRDVVGYRYESIVTA